MALRVVAISAPHYQTGRIGERVLSSSDPVSLFNACRHVAATAARRSGVWGESNWNGTRIERRRSMLLLHSFEADLATFEAALDEVRPHLLLVGAMCRCVCQARLNAHGARVRCSAIASRSCSGDGTRVRPFSARRAALASSITPDPPCDS